MSTASLGQLGRAEGVGRLCLTGTPCISYVTFAVPSSDYVTVILAPKMSKAHPRVPLC